MTISYWLDESANHQKNFDVAIIGAGIAGLSAAYWLEKKDSTLKIAVIDKNAVGAGASGRNAGFITCGSAEHFNKLNIQFGLAKATEIWRFSEENRELLKKEIIQDDLSSVDYLNTGSCTVAPSADDWVHYQKIFADMQAAQIDVELVDEQYLKENYGVRNFQGAIQYKHDGVIHPLKLLKKIQSKLKNTTFLLAEEVFSLTHLASEIKITTQRHQIHCKKVFVCLNGFASQLLPELKNFVHPQRGQVIVTEPLPPFVKGPCYLVKHLCYFRQLPTGELLVGGFRNHDIEGENTAHDAATDKIQNALAEFTKSYFENTANVKINYRWSGIMGFTADNQMLIGENPLRPGVHLMAGCSGHGMGLSFNSARVMIENAIDQIPVPAHFDLNRILLK